MTESDKILTPEYLDWHAKLSGLPSVLTDKIRSNLYKRYKKETGNEPWQLSEAVTSISEKPQASDSKHITFETKPDPELIIKSVLEHFTYLKFLIIIILHHFSHGAHHTLSAMENMEIMDYMAHGTTKMGISSLMILN